MSNDNKPAAAQEAAVLYYVANVELGGDFNYIPISMFDQPAIFATEEKAKAFCAFANGAGSKHEVRTFAAPVAAAPVDADEDAYVIEQMGRLLAEIAVIVNGPEPAGTRWSYHDLPAKVRALASTPAAPGIDLRQFRSAVEAWKRDAESRHHAGEIFPEQEDAIWEEADRLLALIDASPKGGSDAEVMQLRYQLNSLRQLLSGFDVAVQKNPLQPPCTYLEEVRLSHEFQPGEGQKVAAALRNALNSNSEGAKP